MRAAVYRGVDKVVLEEVPVPEIGAREVLVRVAVCGVCGTDLKKIHLGLTELRASSGMRRRERLWRSGRR